MRIRRKTGGSIVEAGAALTLMLPLVVGLVFVIVEVSYAYLIKTSLAQGARQAARDLAVQYGANPSIANSRSQQDATVFDNVRIANMIANDAQFDDPTFNTGVSPHTVHVVVHYASGKYGLPTFPYPDPLHLSGKLNIVADSTYRLE